MENKKRYWIEIKGLDLSTIEAKGLLALFIINFLAYSVMVVTIILTIELWYNHAYMTGMDILKSKLYGNVTYGSTIFLSFLIYQITERMKLQLL